MTCCIDDIFMFFGISIAQVFSGLDAVYLMDTGLSILDLWIIVMLIGMVMDFISSFIEGYYSA